MAKDNVFSNIRISTKLFLLLIILVGLTAAVGIVGVRDLRKSNDEMKTMFQERVKPAEELKNIADAYNTNVIRAAHQASAGRMSLAEALKEVDLAQRTVHDE